MSLQSNSKCRNLNYNLITMHKIVLTSSAMWLFDVIKNVMLSVVPKKDF